MTRLARVAACACLLQALAATAAAQGILQRPALPDPAETGRFRLGFVRFTPSVNISNVGVDTNVFNEREDPKQDVTASFGPRAEFWSRLGPRARVYGSTGLDYQYFQQYESQRSFGTSNIGRVELDLGRLTPFAEGQFTSTRIRPGFEIDSRARREDVSGRAGLALRVQSRTTVMGWAREERFRYGAGEEFLETNLSRALDRDSTYVGGGAVIELTPLTSVHIDAELGEDRFVRSPDRNADTWKVLPGFKFKPFALISGTLAVGYRQFDTVSALVPDFGGVIAAVDLGYVLRATRFTGRYNRDVTYSFENLEPYYLQTDWTFGVTQKITDAWDLVGRAGRYRLDYETVGLPGLTERTDSGLQYGGGVGYTLGQYVRLGVDVTFMERTSVADIARSYEGTRAGFSVSYGLKQR